MEDNNSKFMYFEKLFFRIQLILFAVTVGFFALAMAFLDELENVAEGILYLVLTSLFGSMIIFGLSVIRIIKFLATKTRKQGDNVKRSVGILAISPVTFIIAFILMFVLSLSMASCSS